MTQPTAQDISDIVIQVLEDFAYMSALPHQGETPELPVCFRAALPGNSGWLALSSTRHLARQLAENSTGDAGDGLDEDAFGELCNLSASHLVSQLWAGSSQEWKAFVPEACRPAGAPAVCTYLDVEGQVLEAGFWTGS